jgi:hypothetical protein
MNSRGLVGLTAVAVGATAVGFFAVRAGWPSAWSSRPFRDHPRAPLSDGPLRGGDFVSASGPAEVGRPYSYGLLWVRNVGSKTVVLKDGSLVSPGHGLVVRGMYVQRNNRHPIGFVHGFTPAWGRPLKGVVIRPRQTVQIVVGLALSQAGAPAFHAIALVYESGGRTYEERFPSAGRLCNPVEKFKRVCHPPES